jgi:hypothetical protein
MNECTRARSDLDRAKRTSMNIAPRNVAIGNAPVAGHGPAIALCIAAGLALHCADARAAEEPAPAALPLTSSTLPTAAAESPAARAEPLDLRPPDLTKVYTTRQLDRLIANMEARALEEVEVEGARIAPPTFTPEVWPGIFAPFWALMNPTQAWRILAPLPPDQARKIGNEKFDTEGYLEPLGVPPGDPFKQ